MTHRALFVGDRVVTPARFGGRFSMRYVDDREDAGAVAELRPTELSARDIAELLHPDFYHGNETPDLLRSSAVLEWATAILQEVAGMADIPDGTAIRVLPHGRLRAEFHDLEAYRATCPEWPSETRGRGALPVLGYRTDTGWFAFALFHWPDSWAAPGAIPRLVDAGELLEWVRVSHPATFGDATKVVIV